jgi:glycosyltransferase involved in cell wall biosynthesis
MPQKPKNRIKNFKPFVSVCTPTYNRRPFINYMIKCFQHQDYPKDRMEWIIIDDGTDKIEELVSHIPEVKYFYYEKKMALGEKRNLMHEKSKGSIIVYMDDDDYYPPERVSHAVQRLRDNPDAMCAGSSEMYIYFKHINKMYQFGPYGPNHATAGTFAFKRDLLKNHTYENSAALAEEKAFLKDYTVPFVQLDPLKTILVFSHEHNTFDKKKLLANPHPNYVKESPKTIDMFIINPDMKDFYLNRIVGLLKKYEPGRPEMKPDVMKQLKEMEFQRSIEGQKLNNPEGRIIFKNNDGTEQLLNNQQVVTIIQQQQQQIMFLNNQLTSRDIEIKTLKTQLDVLNQTKV